MKPLVCDICGGDLVVQAGGEKAVCSCCGIQYSLERIREKVLEIRGTVRVEGTVQTNQTGSREDVDQWRKLLEKYYAAGDFQSANQIVKKILEAIPNDPQANQMYDALQVLKDLEVNNGTLVKYHGAAANITIPACVEIIGEHAFIECTSLQHIVLSDTVKQIQAGAFFGCSNLQTIAIPETVEFIGDSAFWGCTSLIKILIPESVQFIGSHAFYNCSSLASASIPNAVKDMGSAVFYHCKNLKEISIPNRFITRDVFEERDHDDGWAYNASFSCPWYKNYLKQVKYQQAEHWKCRGLCQYCGGEFTTLLKTCKKCSRRKDY